MPGEANIDSTFVIRRISSEHSLQLNCPEASCEDTTIKSKDETYFFLSVRRRKRRYCAFAIPQRYTDELGRLHRG
jgi:hypothetical protein